MDARRRRLRAAAFRTRRVDRATGRRWHNVHARDPGGFRAGTARKTDTGDIRPTRGVFRDAPQRFLNAGRRRDFPGGGHGPRVAGRPRGRMTRARNAGGVVGAQSRRHRLCGRCRGTERGGSRFGCGAAMDGRVCRQRARRCTRARGDARRGVGSFRAGGESAGGRRRNTANTANTAPGRRTRPRTAVTQPPSRCDRFSRRRCQSAAAGRMHRGLRRCLPCRCRATCAQNRLDWRNLTACGASPGAPAFRSRSGCRFPTSRRARHAGMRRAGSRATRSTPVGRRPPNGRSRIAPLALGRHRVDRTGDVRRRAVVNATTAARLVVASGETTRSEPEAERTVGPQQKLAPVKTDQPRQADDENPERRERRADMPEQMTERARQRVADRIHAARADERRLERAARQHRADEAEP